MEYKQQLREGDSFRLDMPSIVRDLKNNIIPMILVAIATSMLIYTYQVFVGDDVYSSVARFTISSDGSKYISNTGQAQESISFLQNVLQSDVFRRLITNEIGFEEYTTSLSSITNTNMVTMTVTSSTPEKSFLAMQAILNQYPTFVDSLGQEIYTMMMETPTVPEGITNGNTKIIILIAGFFAGALAYAYLVVLLSITRSTVKNDIEMEEKIDASMLGVIPFEKRNKVDQSKFSTRFMEEYQLCATTLMYQMSRKAYKTLLVTSAMPHEGKTTSTLNLALAMSRENKKVLVIDGDFKNPSIAKTIEVPESKVNGLISTLKEGENPSDYYYKMPNKEVYCLTLGRSYSALEKSFSDGSFQKLLEQVADQFDYVLIDSGPITLVAETELLVGICHASVLLVAQDLASAEAINYVVEVLQGDGECLGTIFKEMYPKANKKRYGYGYEHYTGRV
ncbi:MAG: AAA family ATPase [Eubacteriales bacterium]